jgi:hypothetical protein
MTTVWRASSNPLSVLLLVSLSIAFHACEGSTTAPTGSPGSSSTTSSLTGTWQGTASDSSGPGQMTWVITQSGGSISGTMTLTDTATKLGGRGSISGSVSGSTIRFTLTVPAGGFDAPYGSCTSEVSGEAEVSGTALTGSYSGSNSCEGAIASGQVSLNKS